MSDAKDFKELGEALHRRLLTCSDNRVTAEISELFLPPLAQALKRRFPKLPDPHLAETVAIDTLLAYFERPDKFDPAKSSLISYFYLDASRDLINLIKRQQKFVELHTPLPEYEVRAAATENPETRLLAQNSSLVRRALDRVTSPVDRELLALMMEGVRETRAYAAVLGIADRPPQEQAEVVKRHKDRLKKTLQREIKRKGR